MSGFIEVRWGFQMVTFGKRVLGLSLFTFLVGSALGQSRNAFIEVTAVSGITVTPSNGGLSYLVSVGTNPTFEYNDIFYQITDVIGFYALANGHSLSATNADQGVWKANDNNNGGGGIAGWKSNPNSGLTPGQSFKFTYTTLTPWQVNEMGFDVRINGTFPNSSGNTGHIGIVPEPASMAVLGFGVLAVALRRRKK